MLLHFNADIQRCGGKALATAAHFNNYEAASWLLQIGVDINAGVLIKGRESTVISLATRECNINQDADSRLFNREEEDLEWASASVEMLRYLISCGAKLRRHPNETNPFLYFQQHLSEVATGTLLLDKARLSLDTSVDLHDSSGSGACLLEACLHGECLGNSRTWGEIPHQRLAIFELFFRRGAPVNPGCALALLIHMGGRQELIEEVLEAGADLNACPGSRTFSCAQFTAIQAAASRGNQDLVAKLLHKGADINQPAVGCMGRTALQAACERNALSAEEEACRMSLVKFLLAHGADVNAPACTHRGFTALQAAAMRGNMELAVLLLHRGSDPNASPSKYDGYAALDGAALLGRLDMVQLLLNVGAISDCRGRTGYKGAIRLAEEARHFAVADLIRCHARSVLTVPYIDSSSMVNLDNVEEWSNDSDSSSQWLERKIESGWDSNWSADSNSDWVEE